mmetsp:Transcript_8324/g.10536  ORF Transcript_8324/g.10536 Transcript_8324/m.10536 type:complete len:262 (+) Transcript_8324:195-980(+)
MMPLLMSRNRPVLLFTTLNAFIAIFFFSPSQNLNFNVVEAKKINRNSSHGHFGILKPYSPGPFDLKIDAKDEKVLAGGKSVMKQLPGDDGDELGGKAICVQDVNAPKTAVWNQILDLDHYKGKVSKLKECKNYLVKTKKDGTIQIKTKMVIGVTPGYSYENYYDHTYSPKHDSVTWTLDYDKTSDFNDVSGHWHVEDHPSKSDCSRVFYACDLKFKNSLPGPIMTFLQKTALKQATSWVKRESEGNPEADIPKEFQPSFGF